MVTTRGLGRRGQRRRTWHGRRTSTAAFIAAVALVGALAGRALAQDYPFSTPASGRIVYTRQELDTFNMFTSDPDGSNERRLSDIDESAAGEDQPRWSPDGRHVSFTSYPKGLTTIHVLPGEGGAPRTVVEGDGTSGDPAWSPDGRCLVYDGGVGLSDDDQKRLDLKIWCEDGTAKGTIRRLTNTPDIDEREPDWSPDGETIVYTARSNKPNTTDRWELWRIRTDGTGAEVLVERPTSHERHPRFAPGGGRLAFITGPQPFSFGTLAVLDLATGSVERYIDGSSDTISWSPDGDEILFGNIYRSGLRAIAPGLDASGFASIGPASTRQGGQYAGLYRIHLATKSITRLLGAAGGAQAPNVGTNFEFGYMPDWSPGTATPTPDATATPTPSNTPPPTATATATLEPTPTPAPPRIYLPRVLREEPVPPTPTPTATVTASAEATAEATASAEPTAGAQ